MKPKTHIQIAVKPISRQPNTAGVCSKSTEDGVVLPVALILLVIISFAGILAVRNATVTEQMSNNLRTNVQAQQAAEAALRYCELVAIASKDSSAKQYDADEAKILSAAIDSANSATAAWRTVGNWTSTANNVITPPAAYYTDSSAERDKIKTAPRCLIQPLVNTTHKLDGFLITARGFANNAKWDTSTGKLESGSEAWLQSVLTQ